MSIILHLLLIGSVAADVYCNKPFPGADKIQDVVDLTTFDIWGVNSFLRPVLKFTCGKGHQWTNPYNGITYDLPDQIESPTTVPSTYLSSVVNIMQTLNDVNSQMFWLANNSDVLIALSSGIKSGIHKAKSLSSPSPFHRLNFSASSACGRLDWLR